MAASTARLWANTVTDRLSAGARHDPVAAARPRNRFDESLYYWILAAGVLAVAAMYGFIGDDSFERFFGSVPPVLVVAVVTVVGALSLQVLSKRGWLPGRRVSERQRLSGGILTGGVTGGILSGAMRQAFMAAVVLGTVAVAFDNWIAFPEDMNTPWPQSVLFYPVIAFVAEVILHVLPLAALLAAMRWNLDPGVDDRRVWSAVLIVAGMEAVFQTFDALAYDQRLALFVAPHLFTIGVVELMLLRRHGFLPIVMFRFVYYLIWHIIWGHARLDVLF